MSTPEEIEETIQRTLEIGVQVEELERVALDPSKQLGPLFDTLEQNFAKMGEVLAMENVPAGTGLACLETGMEWIGDFAEIEALALKGMYGGKPKAKPAGGTRPAMRRGMRI